MIYRQCAAQSSHFIAARSVEITGRAGKKHLICSFSVSAYHGVLGVKLRFDCAPQLPEYWRRPGRGVIRALKIPRLHADRLLTSASDRLFRPHVHSWFGWVW
jgi:hypothetical protein